MRKLIKALCSIITILCLAISFSSMAYAAENFDTNKTSDVTLRRPLCMNCGIGYITTFNSDTGPFLYDSHACTIYPGCTVYVYEYYHSVITMCNYCSYGFITKLPNTYSERHSISH